MRRIKKYTGRSAHISETENFSYCVCLYKYVYSNCAQAKQQTYGCIEHTFHVQIKEATAAGAKHTHTHLADQSVYWRIIGSIEARWFAVVRMVIQ